jgi:hypothetical protein
MQLTLDSDELNPPPPPPTHIAAPARAWNWKDVLLITLSSVAFMLVILVPAVALLTWNAPITDGQPKMNLLGISIAALAAEAVGLFAAVFIFGKLRRKYSWAHLGFKSVDVGWWAAAFLLTIAAAIVGGMAAVLVQLVLGLPNENPQLEALAPVGFSWPAAIAMTVLGGIAVPVAEELFFRAVIHRWASEKWGAVIGSLLSSFLFGLAHVSPPLIAFAFVMGLVIAFTYEQTKSLVPGLIIHIINNTLKIILIYALLAFGVPLA